MSALETNQHVQYSSVCEAELHEQLDIYNCADQSESMQCTYKIDSEQSHEETNEKNPFNPKCRIPLPDIYGQYSLLDTSTFIRRRNERERSRVRNVNDAFEVLRQHVPNGTKSKRMSKVETLRSAVEYIRQLKRMLGENCDN